MTCDECMMLRREIEELHAHIRLQQGRLDLLTEVGRVFVNQIWPQARVIAPHAAQTLDQLHALLWPVTSHQTPDTPPDQH